jgi:hypothetical protein
MLALIDEQLLVEELEKPKPKPKAKSKPKFKPKGTCQHGRQRSQCKDCGTGHCTASTGA